MLYGTAIFLAARVTDLLISHIIMSVKTLATGRVVMLIHGVVPVHVAFEATSADAGTGTCTYSADVGTAMA